MGDSNSRAAKQPSALLKRVQYPHWTALSETRLRLDVYTIQIDNQLQEMTTAGSFDAPIEIFGGLVTDMSPADLPHGVSPDCQDVVFGNGGVLTTTRFACPSSARSPAIPPSTTSRPTKR